MIRSQSRRSVLLAALGFIVTVSAAPSPVRAEPVAEASDAEVVWRGPLRLRGQYPLDLPTLDLTPVDARVLGAGEISLEVLVVHSSTFELSPGFDGRASDFGSGIFRPGWDFEVDSESTRLSVRADFGIGERWQLGVELPIIAHGSGFMDSSLQSFHDATGLPNGDREKRPNGNLNIDFIAGDGRFALDESDVALGDVSLHAQVQFFRSRSSAFSGIVDIKAPTGDKGSLAGSGEWDYGVGIIGSIGGARNVFHGGIAHYFLGQPELYPFDVDDRTSAYATYELVFNERWSLCTQVLGATSILLDEGELDADKARVELSVGAHHGSGPFEITFGFSENLTSNDNNIDIGLFFGAMWTL